VPLNGTKSALHSKLNNYFVFGWNLMN
jgi:hypothetical protein